MWRHSWSVMRLRPAAAPGRVGALGVLAGHDRDAEDLAFAWAALALPGVGEDRAEVVGDRRPAVGAGVALGLHDVDAGRDPVAVEHVGPFEAVELGAAQTGVEGDRVGEAVLGLEGGQQRGGLGRERDAHPRLLVVGRELDEAERVALDEPAARRRGPGVDARGERDQLGDRRARQALAGELVDPALPVDLGQLAGEAVAELGAHLVLPAAAHARDRRLRVRLAAAAAPADPASLDAVEPLVAERAEGRTALGELGQVVGALGSGSRARRAPRRGPCVVLLQIGLPRDRIAAPASPGRLAAAARVRIRDRLGTTRVRDVDAGSSGAPPVRHLRP